MGIHRTPRTFLTTRRLLWLIGVATFLGLIVLFVADNFVLIQVRIVNFNIEMRLAWALLFAFLLGGVSGLLLGWLLRRDGR